jgi:hypothetical protein
MRLAGRHVRIWTWREGQRLLILAYIVITLITTVPVMINDSLSVGAAALAGCALSYFGVATFVGSFLARREKKYSATDLAGIGAIAACLTAAGFALVIWSGFRLDLFGLTIKGEVWAFIGICVAIITTRKSDALRPLGMSALMLSCLQEIREELIQANEAFNKEIQAARKKRAA